MANKTYIKAGNTYQTAKPYGGDFDLAKFISATLTRFGVPHVDPCCPALNDAPNLLIQGVRWNDETPGLERYDQDINTWVAIVNAA